MAPTQYTGHLNPPRAPFKFPRCATGLMAFDISIKVLICALLIVRYATPLEILGVGGTLSLAAQGVVLAEIALGNAVLFFCARFEVQGHLGTAWAYLVGVQTALMVPEIFTHAAMFGLAMLLGRMTYINVTMYDLWQEYPEKMPPIPLKKDDPSSKQVGWLGAAATKWVRGKRARHAVSLVCYLNQVTFYNILLLPLALIGVDWSELMPMVEDDSLYWLLVAATLLTLTDPKTMNNYIQVVTVVWKAMRTRKEFIPSAGAHRHGPYGVVELDRDPWGEKLPECRPLTIVIPCYMPNEEGIISDVLTSHRVESELYPSTLHVMVVWNSNREHPEIVEELDGLQAQWPGFRHIRVPGSTSKCDNLNHAIGLLETDFVLFLDADTTVSAQALIWANVCMFERSSQPAFLQCRLAYPRADTVGRYDDGCFCFGPVVVMSDSTMMLVNSNVEADLFGHYPFHGRGGFWRTSAIKKVGFHHHVLGEDFDSTTRAYYFLGYKGHLETNLVVSEQEPNTCAGLNRQRIRWTTSSYQTRIWLHWVMRSKYATTTEKIVKLLCNLPPFPMPFECMPNLVVDILMTMVFFKVAWWTLMYVIDEGALPVDSPNFIFLLCCTPLFFVVGMLPLIETLVNLCYGYYKPCWAVCCCLSMNKGLYQGYLELYLKYHALHNYLWGNNTFLCTPRAAATSTHALQTRLSRSSSSSVLDRDLRRTSVRSELSNRGSVRSEQSAGDTNLGEARQPAATEKEV